MPCAYRKSLMFVSHLRTVTSMVLAFCAPCERRAFLTE